MKDMNIKFIKPSYEIDMFGQTGIDKLKNIEKVARTCYKSEDKITDDSHEKLIRGLKKRNHTAMFEFASFNVKFIASRAFSHELVRHRIGCSFAQESQRYVGYGDAIEFIIPSWMKMEPWECNMAEVTEEDIRCHAVDFTDIVWLESMIDSASSYSMLIEQGWKPEQARDVLPNACKTEINITANLREWINIFNLRDHPTASPPMRELMEPLHIKIAGMIPIIFDQEI